MFQERRNLRVDGQVGPDTWGQLVEAGYQLGDRTLYLHSPLHRGDDVSALQRKLNALGFDAGKEDGLFGPLTDRAVREFQRNVGEEPDGIVGIDTLSTLERMRPTESGPGRAVVREAESVRAMRSSIEGQVVAIDAGARGRDAWNNGSRRRWRTSSRRSARSPWCWRRRRATGSSGVARAANELSASACISLQVAAAGSPERRIRVRLLRQRHHALARRASDSRSWSLEELERELGLPRAPGTAHATRSCGRRGCPPCRSNRA